MESHVSNLLEILDSSLSKEQSINARKIILQINHSKIYGLWRDIVASLSIRRILDGLRSQNPHEVLVFTALLKGVSVVPDHGTTMIRSDYFWKIIKEALRYPLSVFADQLSLIHENVVYDQEDIARLEILDALGFIFGFARLKDNYHIIKSDIVNVLIKIVESYKENYRRDLEETVQETNIELKKQYSENLKRHLPVVKAITEKVGDTLGAIAKYRRKDAGMWHYLEEETDAFKYMTFAQLMTTPGTARRVGNKVVGQATCHKCGKKVAQKKMKLCGRCLSVFYCSQKCQKDDRKSHKSTCLDIDA